MESIKKVLIAKDIKSLIEKEDSFFNRENIKILTSSSNEEAFSIHETEKADLIITHLNSPEMDGETLCYLIRNDKNLRKVSIILVCSAIQSDIERKSQCKANAFMNEPINPLILFEKSHQLLNIAQREALRSPVAVKVQGKYKGKPFLCISENISASGMLFQTDRIIDQRDNIICSFFLPNSVNILTEAEVVRVVKKQIEHDTHHYGVKFLNLSSKYKSEIETYTKEEYQRLKAAFDMLKELKD